MKTIPQRPKTEPTGEMPEKIADTPGLAIQSTRGKIWRALEGIGLLAYKAPRLPDPERESIHLALAHTEKCIEILPEIKNTLWHIYDDLEKIANPKFSELREGHRVWVEKYVAKNINDAFLVHAKALQGHEESIQAFSLHMESSSTLPKIISRLTEIGGHLEHIIQHATEIQNPWEAPNGLEEAISAMEVGHREVCSDYLLAEHENIEQGGTKRKKNQQEKAPQDITPIKRAHMVQERRILTKKDTMILFDKFFPPSTSALILASSWVCLAAKPRDAKFAFDNEYIPTLKEEMQILQAKVQGMKAPLMDRAKAAVAEAQKVFDAEKERHVTAEKEGIKTEWELAAARTETKNAKAHVASILSQYEALTAKKPKNGLDELGFDLAGLLPDDWGSTKEIEKIEEASRGSLADQQEAKDARNIMEQAEIQSEIALQNEEKKVLDLMQTKTKISDIKIAMEKAGESLRQKETFLAEISGTITAIEASKAIAEKTTRKKRLYYWLPGTTATLVAALLGQYFYEPSKQWKEPAEKKEEIPAIIAPQPVAILPPLAVTPPTEKMAPWVGQIVTEAPLNREKLPMEVMTVLIHAGYDGEDDNFMQITNVLVDVLGDTLLATPSQEKRKEIIESVLRRNFHMHAIQARKELEQHFSHEMQNGSLAIKFTPTISREIFVEIDKHGWSKLPQERRLEVLEKVLYRKYSENMKLPQKTKQEVIDELVATMEIMAEARTKK